MRSREEFKEDAILVAMNALMIKYTEGISSPKYVAKKALEYAETITLELYGEELPIIKERRL
jgi:uncharacterized protein with HEPN domain